MTHSISPPLLEWTFSKMGQLPHPPILEPVAGSQFTMVNYTSPGGDPMTSTPSMELRGPKAGTWAPSLPRSRRTTGACFVNAKTRGMSTFSTGRHGPKAQTPTTPAGIYAFTRTIYTWPDIFANGSIATMGLAGRSPPARDITSKRWRYTMGCYTWSHALTMGTRPGNDGSTQSGSYGGEDGHARTDVSEVVLCDRELTSGQRDDLYEYLRANNEF